MARHVQTTLYTASWLVLQHDNTISCCCSWKGRIKSVRQARQAYAKAVHVKPDRAAAWGDAASAFYVEAQLRRAHASMRLEEGSALTQASERCIRGTLASLPDTLILLMQAFCNLVHSNQCHSSEWHNDDLPGIGHSVPHLCYFLEIDIT